MQVYASAQLFLVAEKSKKEIEQLWRDLWDGCIALFYTIFCFMEDKGILIPTCQGHLEALHFIYLPRIQEHLDKFRDAYISKPLRTAYSRCPLQLWISGQALDSKVNLGESDWIEYGVYQENLICSAMDASSVELEPLNDVSNIMRSQINPLNYSECHGIDLLWQLEIC